LGAEYGLQLQESNNTKNVTKQSSSNNNSIHVIKCQTPNINASSKEEAAGAQQHQQQLDKFNKTEDELHPKQPSQQRQFLKATFEINLLINGSPTQVACRRTLTRAMAVV